MKIVCVTPISRGIQKEELYYFSPDNLKEGDIVEVPLRSRVISARVISVKEAIEAKSELKSLPFLIKKVAGSKQNAFLSSEFTAAADETASYFAGASGAMIHALLPPSPFMKEFFQSAKANGDHKGKRLSEKYVFQCADEERFSEYKSIVREEFARKNSVFFCFPTVQEAQRSRTFLSKGLEDNTVCLYQGMSKTVFQKVWKEALDDSHPKLIIGTGVFFGLPRKDIGTIVIENESSRFYKSQRRPFPDFRFFAEILSAKMGIRLILADSFLRAETIARFRNGDYAEYVPLKFRLFGIAKEEIVSPPIKDKAQKNETVLSAELASLIKENKEHSENLFILCGQRGLYPRIICGDCGKMVFCPNCRAFAILRRPNNIPQSPAFFFCKSCGYRWESLVKCANCGSWKLVPLGVGIELVKETIHSLFPDVKIFHIDKDSTASVKKSEKAAREFAISPGSILLGTELALSFIEHKIENCAIVSIDSLFSIPHFRMEEELLHLILRVKSLASKNFLIQTANLEERVLISLKSGSLTDFYREEIADRKKFGYPPFKVLVVINWFAKENSEDKDGELIKHLFGSYSPEVFEGLTGKMKNKKNMRALMRFSPEKWPDKEILEKIFSLPAKFTVIVDPENIF